MKISLRWIEEILESKIDLSPSQLSKILLNLGFEVTSTLTYPKCTGVVLGEIVKISPHPNADRLRVVAVTDGRYSAELVCGAPNLTLGQKCLWAKLGAILSDGQELKRAVLRGVPSEGMLLSSTELGVGEHSQGLWEFWEDSPLGSPLEDLVTLEDTIFDLEITPNRPDCLSHTGIAREIATALNGKQPKEVQIKIPHSAHPEYSVIIENGKDCPHYIARKLENITVGPSPLQMQTRLVRCGIRPINNLVDITNAILLEVGQPLHAFDADRLEGSQILVRNAFSGESLLTLDGKNVSLDPEILVIADAKKAVAIAGVMGGELSSVTPQTKNVLLESAVFNPARIRKNRMKLGLSSESSSRFERGVSHWSCETGSGRASEEIETISHGVLTKLTNMESNGLKNRMQTVHVSQVNRVLGLELTLEEISSQLQKISVPIHFKDAVKLEVESPPWRLDLEQEIDFIEEIARVKGYSQIPTEDRPDNIGAQLKIEEEETHFISKIKRVISSMGFSECINYGLIGEESLKSFGWKENCITLENPTSQEQSILRPSLVPELFNNLKTNLSYQKKSLKLFEVGTIHLRFEGEFLEKTHLAAIATGYGQPPYWNVKDQEKVNLFWMKGILDALFQSLTLPKLTLHPLKDKGGQLTPTLELHPEYGFELRGAGEDRVGMLGMLHPKRLKGEKISNEVAFFELDCLLLKELAQGQKKYFGIKRTPKIERDCSLWVDHRTPWSEIESEIFKAGGDLLEECTLFDLYKEKEAKERKSLSFTLTFRDPKKSLSDEYANHLRDKIISHLESKFKAHLRK